MKKILSLSIALLLLFGAIFALAACNGELTDYAGQLVLDMSSERAKVYATVKTYIDGDTTHFHVNDSQSITGHLDDQLKSTGVLKARYLAINTPESTGQIEPFGKKASNFTKEKLKAATSIIIESDTANWDVDSTGSRYTVWVWYKTEEAAEYRNLNLEILQEGLAWGSNSGGNSYGDICLSALDQAGARKLNVFSEEQDPDYYYDETKIITLKELRTNIESYTNVRVAVEGVVVSEGGNTVYIQDYDAETDTYYGMAVYYGFKLSGGGKKALSVGNRVRVGGSVQYYEAGGTYQISDVKYDPYDKENINNIKVIEQNVGITYREVTPDLFFGKQNVEVEVEEDVVEKFDFAQVSLNTAVEMKNLVVKKISTTTKEDSSNKGAMSIYCTATGADGKTYEVTVRTAVLTDETGTLYTAADVGGAGTVLNAKGLIEYYVPDYEGGEPVYQIKVLTFENLGITK